MKQITKSSDALTRKNIINRISDIPGGVSLVLSTLTAGKIIPEGTPLSAPSSGKRTVCKQAKILAGSTTTVFRVASATNPFKTGDIIMQGASGKAYGCTVVAEVGTDDDGVLYDTVTTTSALESATAGTWIYQSSAEGASAGALSNAADVMLKHAFTVPSDTQVIWMADAYLRADVVEDCIGDLYVATLDVKEVKY